MPYQIYTDTGRPYGAAHESRAMAEAALAKTPHVGCPVRGYKIREVSAAAQQPALRKPLNSYEREHLDEIAINGCSQGRKYGLRW